MSVHEFAATWLGHWLSTGDAPGSGPGLLETILGLPGMPGELKKAAEAVENPDRPLTEDDIIEMMGDMAPLPVGPVGEALKAGKAVTNFHSDRTHEKIRGYQQQAKGVPGNSE